jgi:Fic family protein
LEYYDRLQAIRDRGDWEGWLRFFLRGVNEVAQEATAIARQIVNMREEHRDLLGKRLGRASGKALALLETLYFRPIVSVHSVVNAAQLSFANANALVKHFQDLGLLREITGQKRNRRFSYDPYLNLFKDPEVEVPRE